jgi:two-component system sensor histidine kinase/response regulator
MLSRGEDPVSTNLIAWDVAEALKQLGGDEPLLHEVVLIFLEEIPGRMTRLRAAIDEGDGEAIEKEAHTLNGELGYLAVSNLCLMARELEQLGRENDLENAASLFESFEIRMTAVLASMRDTKIIQAETKAAARPSGASQ